MDAFLENEVLKKIELIFRDIFLDDSLIINKNTSPLDIDEWDSLAHVNLLITIETAFNVHFTAEDMGDIQDVSTLILKIEARSCFRHT